MRTVLLLALTVGCTEYDYVQETETIDDRFEVEGVRSDILFFGDTSTSMQRELITLSTNVQRFIDRLETSNQDWQLAAVTGPDGCAQGGILTPETPDYATRFATGITTSPGQEDVDEWGLHNAMRAVLRSVPGGCNQGFLREDATLHVIFLSDEDDNSPGWEASPGYWRDYVDPILYAKGDPELVKFSAIGGPVPGGCTGADPALGYWDAVNATGGEFLSICDAWEDRLELLANASVTRDTFPLSRAPVVETLEVWVDEVERTSGWAWEPGENLVRFFEDLPSGGESVRVHYTTLE